MKPTFTAIPSYGEHMTWERFILYVQRRYFIDYDGIGDLATATQVSDVSISPSDVVDRHYAKPEWATHVVWYNR